MSGRARVMVVVPGLAGLAATQHDVVSRAQLRRLGVSANHVRAHCDAGRWRQVGPLAVALHRGPLDGPARTWAAALTVAPVGCLAGWSALAWWGLQRWEPEQVHVVVPRGATPPRLPWVRVHESRRHGPADVRLRDGMALHGAERAAVDAGAWSATPRAAGGVLAAVVQQGITTADRLQQALESAGAVRHRRLMSLVLVDVAAGARSMAEVDVARLCRRAGLPEPVRQARRRDGQGRWRYLDVEWRLSGGRWLLLEIDGVGHMDVERWYDDLMRAADVARPGEVLLRLPALAARTEPDRVVALLRRHLV